MERTVIIYHDGCPDGFGGAFAAWKKFGDTVEYMPRKHGQKPPENLAGAHVYFIDFSYPKEIMEEIVKEASHVTVLDHHEGVREVVEQMPEFIYDAERSGATIAWTYFHPQEPIPVLLRYVEEGDLYRFTLPDARALLAYAYTKPFTFESWSALLEEIEDPEQRARAITRGGIYTEYGESLVRELADGAKLVRFEGYECYFSPTISVFSSALGHVLARKKAPLALAVQARPDGLRVSLRGDGSVDVAKICQKYGGNGHPNSAAFSLPWGTPIPWEPIDEDTRD